MNTPKKPARQDWHKEDIKAAVRKTGTNFSQLGLKHGFRPDALHCVLHRPLPKWEAIVAAQIGEKPQTIWPSRYRADGSPKSGRGERGLGRYKRKSIRPDAGCNVRVTGTNSQPKGAGK